MAAIFKEADVNGDGFITWPEAQKAGAEYKRTFTPRMCSKGTMRTTTARCHGMRVSTYVKDSRGKETTPGTTRGY